MTLIEALIINFSAWLKVAGHIIFYNGCTEALSILHSLHWLLDWRFIYPSKPIATFFWTYYNQHCNGCTEALIINLSAEPSLVAWLKKQLLDILYSTITDNLICFNSLILVRFLLSAHPSDLAPIICQVKKPPT